MLPRSILRLSTGQSKRKIPKEVTTQVPSYLLSRREFSVSPKQTGSKGPDSTGKPQETSLLPRFIFGTVALGAGFIAAYQTGYLDKYLVKEPHPTSELARAGADIQDLKENEVSPDSEIFVRSDADSKFIESGNVEQAHEIGTLRDLSEPEEPGKVGSESQFQVKDSSEITEVTNLPSSSDEKIVTPEETRVTKVQSSGDSLDTKSPELTPDVMQHQAIETTSTRAEDDTILKESDALKDAPHHDEKPNSLLDEYCLRDGGEAATTTSSAKHKAVEDLADAYISKDGKLVLDFLQAIHEAERRQADIDARLFSEEKKFMKEKYEKELKDARARELMYAEREALLDKELIRERAKAIAALKSLQEKLEEKHRMELEEKEAEAELKLKKVQDLSKAELEAAIASEKASQIEKMAEANLHINALCMAFYARSEEARQSHSVHKLALGVLALEDALSRGLPIQKEIEVLHTSLEGVDNNSLLELVLSSLPEETRRYGSDTVLQLNHKFDSLKRTLRHFSLIPPDGGGILTHSLASVASWLKVRERNQSGDGVESLINRVESLLGQGKLAEAADVLEKGLKGSQAAAVVDDWVKLARDRAITEQALTLLQSYATTISIT